MNNGDRRQGRWRTAAAPALGLLILTGTAVGLRSPERPVPKRHEIEIKGVAFVPAVLEVQQGDTVVWINRDLVPHTSTALRKGAWDSGPLAQGDSASYVAGLTGEERYACLLHPTMTAKLIVR